MKKEEKYRCLDLCIRYSVNCKFCPRMDKCLMEDELDNEINKKQINDKPIKNTRGRKREGKKNTNINKEIPVYVRQQNED